MNAMARYILEHWGVIDWDTQHEYVPWTHPKRSAHVVMGYRVLTLHGTTEYIYIVPTILDGKPMVAVYRGPHGSPDLDELINHI